MDARTRLVYVADLPFEVPDDPVKGKFFSVVMALSSRWIPRFNLVCQMFLTVRVRLKVLWSGIYHQRFALLVMVLTSGIKASLTSARCVARLVIVFRTVPSVECAVATVDLGKCLASVFFCQPPVSAPASNSVPSVPDSVPPRFNTTVPVSGRDPSVYRGWGQRPGFRWSFCLSAWPLLWWRRGAQFCSHFCFDVIKLSLAPQHHEKTLTLFSMATRWLRSTSHSYLRLVKT